LAGATVDVCFTKRDDSETSTDFKVVDFLPQNFMKDL
jgi:hypothetical protein